VTRHGNTLTVVLEPGIDLDPMVIETASVRVLGAVRPFDRDATIIDVATRNHLGSPLSTHPRRAGTSLARSPNRALAVPR
jgi:hypothetical protein